MSGYDVWHFDGRAPELLGAAADKGAARKLWRNSRHAVIAAGGVVLETRSGTSSTKAKAMLDAVGAAWRAAGGAPPEPLPVPGTKVPGTKPARAARPKPPPAEDEGDEPDDEGREEDDDLDGDDPDDPPEVDLAAELDDEERETHRGPGDIDVHDLEEVTVIPEASPGAPGNESSAVPSSEASSDAAPPLRETPPTPAPKRPRGRPRVDRTQPPAPPATKKPPRDPRWQRMAGEAHTAFRLIARIGGLEQLRKLANPPTPPNPVQAVAAMGARELERLHMANCCEWEVAVGERPMRVTAQWVDGKSPLTLRTEALAERDAAVAALTAAQAASVRVRQLVERAGGIERLESIVERFEGLLKLGGAR